MKAFSLKHKLHTKFNRNSTKILIIRGLFSNFEIMYCDISDNSHIFLLWKANRLKTAHIGLLNLIYRWYVISK